MMYLYLVIAGSLALLLVLSINGNRAIHPCQSEENSLLLYVYMHVCRYIHTHTTMVF